MNVKIYEEQTGLMIFPVIQGKEPDKDESVINLFNNGIDLYVEKKAKELRISCHVFAQKSPEENKGYYIKSLSKYEDDSFAEFKKESNKVLRTMGLQHTVDDVNNVTFDNIEKLDLDIYFHEDTEIIENILASGEYLEYKAGNIDEITIFCKDILKKINSSKIAISSKENTLGDINILKTQRQEESLRPNERTRQLLDKHKKDLIEKKRKEDENRAKEKINNGVDLIKDGLTILRSTGYEPKEISTEIDKVYDEISTSNKIKLKEILKPKEKEKSKDKGKEKGKDKVKDDGDAKNKSKPNIILIIIILIVGALLLYSIIWGFPFNSGGTSKEPGQDTPVPVATLPPIKNIANNVNINSGNNDPSVWKIGRR